MKQVPSYEVIIPRWCQKVQYNVWVKLIVAKKNELHQTIETCS